MAAVSRLPLLRKMSAQSTSASPTHNPPNTIISGRKHSLSLYSSSRGSSIKYVPAPRLLFHRQLIFIAVWLHREGLGSLSPGQRKALSSQLGEMRAITFRGAEDTRRHLRALHENAKTVGHMEMTVMMNCRFAFSSAPVQPETTSLMLSDFAHFLMMFSSSTLVSSKQVSICPSRIVESCRATSAGDSTI